MRRIAQSLLLLVAATLSAESSPINGSGKVAGRVNTLDGTPLAGATILVSSTFDFTNSLVTAVTNRNGEFQLVNLEPGQYAVKVTQQGYQPHLKAPVDVRSGTTTQLVLILQNLVSPTVPETTDNWDFRTVLRSTRDRKLIFRERETTLPQETLLPPAAPAEANLFGITDQTKKPFTTSAAVEAYADGAPGVGGFDSPDRAGAGLRTNFGYATPISEDSRYVVAGQLNSGFDSVWKVKNQLDIRPNDMQLLTVNLTYSRLGYSAPRMSSLLNPASLSSDGQYVSGFGAFQTLTLGVESFNKILPPLTMIYGMDLAFFKGTSSLSSFISPSLQIVFEPTGNLAFRALMSGRRTTDADRVRLPSGDSISLSEPFRLFQNGQSIGYERGMHYEVGVARRLTKKATLELGTYADKFSGSPAPILAFVSGTEGLGRPNATSLTLPQAENGGVRVLVNKKFWDFLSSSVAYVYGSSATINGLNIVGDGEVVRVSDISKEYFHSFTAQVEAEVVRTRTYVSTRLRWVPGSPTTTVDAFSDEYGLGNGSLRISVRQAIPMPDLLGMSGRWEALFDVKDQLDLNDSRYPLSSGQYLILRNPRFIRVGIAYRM